MEGFTSVWEFRVRPGQDTAFLEHYGPEGTWARLFRRAPGFVETLLLRDLEAPLRFLTVDRWESAAAYREFRQRFDAEYLELDRLCEGLAETEVPLGQFTS